MIFFPFSFRGNQAFDNYHVTFVLDSATIHTAKAIDMSGWTLKPSKRVRCFVQSITYNGRNIELVKNGVFKQVFRWPTFSLRFSHFCCLRNLYTIYCSLHRGVQAIAEELGIKEKQKEAKEKDPTKPQPKLLQADYINYCFMHEAFQDCDVRMVEQIVREYNDISIVWLPKFHPELNPIELVWAYVKQHTRRKTDWTKKTLIKNILEAREQLPAITINRYIRRTKKIADMFLEGKNLSEIFEQLYNRRLKGNRQNRLIVPIDEESEL